MVRHLVLHRQGGEKNWESVAPGVFLGLVMIVVYLMNEQRGNRTLEGKKGIALES
jgi:hypothetical protein